MLDKVYERSLLKHVESFKVDKEDIVRRWINSNDVLMIFRKYKISSDFFGKFFAPKVLGHIIAIMQEEEEVGHCPVIEGMLVFFHKKSILLEDIFIICVGLKNCIIGDMLKKNILNEDTLNDISTILDHNFVGVMRSYGDSSAYPKITCSVSFEEEKNRSYPVELDSIKKQLSARAYLQENDIDLDFIDRLGDIEDDIFISFETLNTMNYTVYRDIACLFNDYLRAIESLHEFHELSNSLELLVELFEQNATELMSGENAEVLSIYVRAIISDLSMWRKSVFVKKDAFDIHYLDATLFSSIAQLQITLCSDCLEVSEEIEFF